MIKCKKTLTSISINPFYQQHRSTFLTLFTDIAYSHNAKCKRYENDSFMQNCFGLNN